MVAKTAAIRANYFNNSGSTNTFTGVAQVRVGVSEAALEFYDDHLFSLSGKSNQNAWKLPR